MNNSTNITKVTDLTAYFQYVGFGSTAVVTNCIILLILFTNTNVLKKSAFYVGLALGDLLDGLSLLVSGAVRITNVLNGLNQTVHPFYCFSKAYTSLFLLGNQIPGAMFFLIGFERFLAVHYFDWYRIKWNAKKAWFLTTIAYIYVAISLLVGAIITYVQPKDSRISLSCGTPTVVGNAYSIYNYGVSIVGGTVAAICTLASTAMFAKRHQRLKTNATVSHQIRTFVKKQWRQTRAMLCLAIIDVALVVVPNVLAALVTGFKVSIPNVNLGGLSLQLSCSRSFFNIIIYFVVNREFRNAAFNLVKCRKNNTITGQSQSIPMEQTLKGDCSRC